MGRADATLEERLRSVHSTLALIADMGAIAAATSEPTVSPESFHAIGRMAATACADIATIARALPAKTLNISSLPSRRRARRRND